MTDRISESFIFDEQKTESSRLLSLSGEISGIIFQNEQNGYTVCELDSDTDELVVAVGSLPYITEGEEVTLYGRWTHHAEYGRQFKVENYEKHLPATEGAILRYLSSGAVKGVGPVTAAKIVKSFGTEAFDVMENHPEWLSDIPGISKKKAADICEDFKKQAGVRSVMIFCRDFFGPALAVRVYKTWGSGAVDIIKNNPYRLCAEIDGIGFETADSIAEKLGMDRESRERIKSGIIYIFTYNAFRNGHTCIPRAGLASAAAKLMGVSPEAASNIVSDMIASKELKLDGEGETEYVFTSDIYRSELLVASKLCLLDKRCDRVGSDDVARLIFNIEYEEDIVYAELQKKAIHEALGGGIFVLTGGPGTGKTTVIRAIIRILKSMGQRVVLAAPTGRAAKRMSEATSCEAKTIHRLLEMDYNNSGGTTLFIKNENNMLEADTIIIDEASMVDLPIAEALLRAIRPGARLILIGDADQLPPVGYGNVFLDIIESGAFNTVCLTEIFRQAKESLIVTNAHAINSGIFPEIKRTDSDFFFMKREYEQDVISTIAELCAVRLPKTYGEEIVREIQVISPSRKGRVGTERINSLLQQRLNPPDFNKAEIKRREVIFRVGDRVMQTKNNYAVEWERAGKAGMGIFNGDVGIIEEIDSVREFMRITFDDREVKYDFTLLDDLEHAYAMTVHKSQGSEYRVVIMPFYRCAPMLLTRNLLYTAVTRAKEMLILVGSADIMSEMIANNQRAKRYTGLCRRLAEVSEQSHGRE